MDNNQISHFNLRASLILYCTLTCILLILLGTIFYAYGKLPSGWMSIVGSPAGIIMAICIVLIAGIVGLWQTAIRRKLLINAKAIISVGLAIAVSIGFVFVILNRSETAVQISTTSVNSNNYVALQEPWDSFFYSYSPFCDNSAGAVWSVHQQGTVLSCTDSGLAMQQISTSAYAQVDLDQVRDTAYDQTSFQVKVNVSFDNPRDIRTRAALIVQTPEVPGITGGYLFLLNPLGEWQLQLVEKASSIQTIQSGSTMIDPSRPTTIKIRVKDQIIHVSVNDHQVTTSRDILSPRQGAVGFLVAHPGGGSPSALVTYSSFELDRFVLPSQGPKTGTITKNLPLVCSHKCDLPTVTTVLTAIGINQEIGVTTFNFQFVNGSTKAVTLHCQVNFDNGNYLSENTSVLVEARKSGTASFSLEAVPYSGEKYPLEVRVSGSNWQNVYQTVDLFF